MGSLIELNDTLKLKRDQGFPQDLKLDRQYSFQISGRRLYHLAPTRVYLVEEVAGFWNYRGHALIHSLEIDAATDTTSGMFTVSQIYTDEQRLVINQTEPPVGKQCFRD
ncbi:hypothetical protein JNK13_08575 [bacterium]|nr:hypothetical protein [bacterium]